MPTQAASRRAWRTLRWCVGLAVAGYLLLGVAIAVQGRPQQLWACPDPSSPSGEMLHSGDRPSSGCEATVSSQDQVKSFAMGVALGPAWVLTKALYGND